MTASRGDSIPGSRKFGKVIPATAVALIVLAICVFPGPHADAKQKKHHNPETNMAQPNAAAPAAATPEPGKTPSTSADPAKPDAQAAKKPETWTDAEIADAKAHCTVVLNRIHAVAIAHAPIREGECGAPAPVELISIGQNPEIALSPPAIVRCDLVEQLANWFEKDVQPLARKHLKSEIIKIETMSSYSCRNAYGRTTTKLSEHGLANALDIGGFITASAKTAEVLDDWGKPQREILAEAAERKKAADEAAAEVAQAGVAGNPVAPAAPSPVPSTAGAAVAGLTRSTIIDGAPNSTETRKAASIVDASRLGGPAPRLRRAAAAGTTAYIPAQPEAEPDPEVKAFLHEVHEAACRTFGTTLGPEANAAHRNHFHVDMAPRKFTKICD
ncbi:MAG: extensin family protein [Hyphomicrobium sp.]